MHISSDFISEFIWSISIDKENICKQYYTKRCTLMLVMEDIFGQLKLKAQIEKLKEKSWLWYYIMGYRDPVYIQRNR